jgi:metal-sulfur cluster biosynthetic enzyme
MNDRPDMAAAALTEAGVRQALQAVVDPEVGESIVELGLVDQVHLASGRIEVVLVPTSATCPMADVLLEDATEAVQHLAGPAVSVRVRLDFEQVWTPERMSPALRERFGWGPAGG